MSMVIIRKLEEILRENEDETKDDHGLNRIEYNSGDVMFTQNVGTLLKILS